MATLRKTVTASAGIMCSWFLPKREAEAAAERLGPAVQNLMSQVLDLAWRLFTLWTGILGLILGTFAAPFLIWLYTVRMIFRGCLAAVSYALSVLRRLSRVRPADLFHVGKRLGERIVLGIPFLPTSMKKSFQSRSSLAASHQNMAVELGDLDANIQRDLLRKLDKINRTSRLMRYAEGEQIPLSQYRQRRLQRAMHYDVSLRPFTAVIHVDGESDVGSDDDGNFLDADDGGVASPFMCTPQSFPPTPISRAHVMARSNHFNDDVLFLARDHLRLAELARSDDPLARETASNLKKDAKLAILNPQDCAEGIALTSGSHCATKFGGSMHCSVRAMAPISRNRWTYFQISILSHFEPDTQVWIGLSTVEMPLNSLVGSWSHSVGIGSKSQIQVASRWYGRPDILEFGSGSTVGILVYIDDSSIFESWDGDMVHAEVCFTVNNKPLTGFGVKELTGKPLTVPKDEDVFPTITLSSVGTQVMSRFGAEDILHARRSAIGAPDDVLVYALDGSIILQQHESGAERDSVFPDKLSPEAKMATPRRSNLEQKLGAAHEERPQATPETPERLVPRSRRRRSLSKEDVLEGVLEALEAEAAEASAGSESSYTATSSRTSSLASAMRSAPEAGLSRRQRQGGEAAVT